MSDPARSLPAHRHRSPPHSDTVLVYTYDSATLQVIRDFLEPLGFNVEVAPAADLNSVEAD